MRYIVFDTETNGLPKSFDAPPSDHLNWPRMLEIAWRTFDVTDMGVITPVEDASYLIVPPKDLVWDTVAESIHHISRDRAVMDGRPLTDVMEEFQRVISGCRVVFAHNIIFDLMIVNAEAYRMNMLFRWPCYSYCTSNRCGELVRIPSKYPRYGPWKQPRLKELYDFLLPEGKGFEAHTAAGDVGALGECVSGLFAREHIKYEDWVK